MGNRGRVDRIELIEPGSVTMFAPAAPSPPAPPARRWTRLIAPVALVAIIGIVAAVATSGAGFGSDRATPPSSQPLPRTPASAPRAPTTAPTAEPSSAPPSSAAGGTSPAVSPGSTDAPLEHLLGVLPLGYQPASASESVAGGRASGGTPSAAVLWADGVDAAAGTRWLLADAWSEGSPGAEAMSLVGTVRVDTALGPAVAHRDGDVLSITGPIDGGLVSIHSTGITLDELTHLVSVLRLDDGRLTVDDTVLRMGFHLVAQATADSSVPWSAAAHTDAVQAAASLGGPSATLSVDIGPEMSGFQQALQSFFVVAHRRVDVGGRFASLGTDSTTGRRLLSVELDGVHVDVSATGLDDQAILDYAASLRPVPIEDWQAMLAAAPRPAVTPSGGRVQHRLAAGTVPGAVAWLVKIGVDPALPGSVGLEFDQSSSDGPRYAAAADLDAAAPRIAAAATPTLTFVAAAVPAGTGAATLRVTVGPTMIDAPLAPADGTTARLAVAAFGDVGAYTAQIVAADGTVLAAFDPLGAPPA